MAEQIPQPTNVTVPPELATGLYANAAVISSQTPHDVTLDFIQLIPGTPAPVAMVVARLKLAPTFLMPLMQVLSTHLSQHEAFTLQVEAAAMPDIPSPDAEEEDADEEDS